MNWKLRLKYLGVDLLAGAMRSVGFDPLVFAYKSMGILRYESPEVGGERYFLEKILPKMLADRPDPVLFDVGANVGNYARMLRASLPDGRLLAFEPNPNTFSILQKNRPDAELFCLGFGEKQERLQLFTYADSLASSHASLYESAMTDLHGAKSVVGIEIELDRLDDFCEKEGITAIDFLKMDTEGHELAVLRGAEKLLAAGQIGLIQFEFNDLNVASRTFLKDFYDRLPGFDFYRIHARKLLPLGAYRAQLEIFQYQNIVAVRRKQDGSHAVLS